MKIIKKNKKKIKKEEINLIADYFKKGKVIVYPTDTIYGLGCLATDKKAINKIYKIKKRKKGKALLILISSLAMLKKYCYVSKGQEKFLKSVWKFKTPRAPLYKGGKSAVTVILKSRGVLPRKLAGEGNSLAVRLPRNEFLIKIIKKVGRPIVSTSVNISGEKSLASVENVERYFKTPRAPLIKGAVNLPDLVVDAGKLKNKPSKIADIRDIKNIKILRK